MASQQFQWHHQFKSIRHGGRRHELDDYLPRAKDNMHRTRLYILMILCVVGQMIPAWWCSSAGVAAVTPKHPRRHHRQLQLQPANTPWPIMGSSSADAHFRDKSATTPLSSNHRTHLSSESTVLSDTSYRTSSSRCHCHIFIWDFPSYFKYHHVLNLSRQYTIEGLGGKKFIRIPPNSILEKFYPQLVSGQLKPNKCWLCGYSWQDHLKFWWDCRKRRGDVEVFDRFVSMSSAAAGTGGRVSGEGSYGDETKACYEQYVHVVTDKHHSKRRSTMRRKKLEDEIRHTLDGRVSFMVPRFDPAKHDGGTISLGSLLLLALARIQALIKVEELIWLHDTESSSRAEIHR